MGSFMGRGNQYIQLVKVLYCKLLTISKKLPSFPHWFRGLNLRGGRRVFYHRVTVAPWPFQVHMVKLLKIWISMRKPEAKRFVACSGLVCKLYRSYGGYIG